MNKMKKVNEYKGRTFNVSGPAGFDTPATVISSYNYLCLAEYFIGGVGGRHKTYGIYKIMLDGEGREHLSPIHIDYNTDSSYDTEAKTGAPKDVVKAKFDAMVAEMVVADEAAEIRASQDAINAITEAKRLEAKAKINKSKALKQQEAFDTRYKDIGVLKVMFNKCSSVKSLLKDKAAKALIDEILACNVLLNNYNSQIA